METLSNSFPVKVIMSEMFWGVVILSLVLWLLTLGFLVYIYLVKARDFQSQIDRIESTVSYIERLMIAEAGKEVPKPQVIDVNKMSEVLNKAVKVLDKVAGDYDEE